jgi:hypothetical protein
MEEVWKSIGIKEYQISNLGNLKNGDGKLIGGYLNQGGYRATKIDRTKTILYHHLVAEAFIGVRPEGLVIDHIDRNRSNNFADNLRYVSYQDNARNSKSFRSDIPFTDIKDRQRIQKREYMRRKNNSTPRYENNIAKLYRCPILPTTLKDY